MDNSETRKCPHDCRLCSLYQQVYCASQVSLSTMDLVQSLADRFDALVAEIKGKEQPIVSPVAQRRAAAQKVDSQDKQTKEE